MMACASWAERCSITKQDYAYDPSGKYPDASYGGRPRWRGNYLVSQMNLLGDPAMRLLDPSYIPRRHGCHRDAQREQRQTELAAVTHNMSRAATTVTPYGIWRSTQPYFDPDAMNCNCAKIGRPVLGR